MILKGFEIFLIEFNVAAALLHDIQLEKGACGRIKPGKTMTNTNVNDLYCLCTICVRKQAPAANLKRKKNVKTMIVHDC